MDNDYQLVKEVIQWHVQKNAKYAGRTFNKRTANRKTVARADCENRSRTIR